MSHVDVGRWADTLLHRYADRRITGSMLFPLIQPAAPGGDLILERVPLGGHPVHALRRYRPPTGCVALGLVSAGWAAPMDDSGLLPSAHPDAQRVVQSFVLASSGAMAGRLRYPDGHVLETGEDGQGRVVDALTAALCRRRAA